MPKYEIDVPGKGTYEVDSPTELTDAQAYAAIQSQLNQKPEKESPLRQVADVPLNVTKGVVSGVRMLSDAFGADNAISKNLRGVEDYVGGLLSAQAKNDQKEIDRIMKEAEDKGVLDQIKAGLNAFAVAPVDLMSQAFGTVIPTLAGGLAGAGLKIGARAAGVLTGATMGAGTGKSAIYDAVTEELSKANLPKEVIEQAAIKAQEYGGQNLDLILANTLLGGVAGTTGIEKALIPGLSKRITEKVAQRGVVGRAAATGFPEAGTEFLQGGTEQASKNIALQREGYDVPTMRGVYSAGTMEGAAGFGMGAAAGALKGQTVPEQTPPTQLQNQEQIAPTEPVQAPFTPTVIPPAYSMQEGIDRATGVNAESGYTQSDLLTPGAAGVREQAQRMATQDLNAVGTPRAPMTEEGRIAAQQAAFDRATQELGYTDQRQPLPVSPAQSQPYTAPAPVSIEERRKLADAQSAQLAQAQNEPFAFDRRRLEASASQVGGTGQVRGQPRAVMIEPNPMVPRAARQRLAVLKEDLIAKGEDPASLAIVPHPTMGGRFAIEQRTMEQPYVAPPIETPTVSQAEANKSLESIDAEKAKDEYLAQKDLKTLAGKRGEEIVKNVPSAELAPFVEVYQKLRRNIEENIANRNGVATPEEARIIRDQGLTIPYDSVAEIAADADTPLNTKSKRLLEVEAAFDKEKRKHLKEMYGPEFFEQFGVPEAAPKQASAEFTGKFLNPEGRTAPAAPSTRTAARTSPEQFGQRSDTPQASQYAGKLEVSEDGRYEQLPFQQKTDAPKIQTFNKGKYSLQDVVATPEAKAMADDVKKKLLPVLKRFGLEKMGLRLVDSIEGGAEGMYFKSIITLALDSNNPMGVMRHEVIHALKELGAFTTGEWKVLTDMAKKKWINQFYSPKTQAEYKAQYEKDGDTTQTFDEYMAEEAIAQAFRFYTETKPPSGMIANLMRRLNNVFQAIREFFMGNGVTDAEQLFLAKQIFSGIESGRMTAGRAGVQPKTSPAYAFKSTPAPKDIPQNLFDLQRKADRITAMANEKIPSEPNANGIFPRPQDLKREQTLSFRRLNKAVEDHLGVKNNGEPNNPVMKMLTRLSEESTKKGGYSKYSLPEEKTYKLDIDREVRKTAKSAVFTEAENKAVEDDAARLNLSPAQTAEILSTIKKQKKQFPATQGWDNLTVIGIDQKLDDLGNPIAGTEFPKYEPITYGYGTPPDKTKAPSKIDQVWMDKVADAFTKQIQAIYRRADKGDKNALSIIAHKSWYKGVAKSLRQDYGAFGDILADLLGATSPNTPVDTNWKFSIDVLKRFARGDFDTEMKAFTQYLDTGGVPSKYPAAQKIRQISGKLYGMNSTNAMLGLADMWRAIVPGQAPKARNFALNLIGQSDMATIDVWAARMLRRVANNVSKDSFKRIPPPAEKGVTGMWNASATKVTGEFGFGAAVMDKVSKDLKAKGIDIAPPDLQAIAWFAEKELWGNKGWTSKVGEGGSFEENIQNSPVERYVAAHSVQEGDTPPSENVVNFAKKVIVNALGLDKNVVTFRTKETKGLYGGTVEESFDTEWVAQKGKFDPTQIVSILASTSKQQNQYDFFVSKILGPNEESLNARPGVEIYFKNQKSLQDVLPLLKNFTSKGQDGFTLAVDPRVNDGSDKYIGVRLQYVPEISMRWDNDLRKKFLKPDEISRVLDGKRKVLLQILSDIASQEGIAHAELLRYDTLVVGKENYNDYISKGNSTGDQKPRGVWFGGNIAQHIKEAAKRYSDAERADRGAVVGTGDQEQVKLEGKASFRTTEKGARFSRALGSLEPATFLVPDTSLNNTGNLGMMPDAREIEGKPIRLAVGLEDANTSKGYGATHILKRIEKDSTRKPPVASKELLEDLVRNVEKTAQSFTRLYRDRNNLIAYNPITTESLILAERPDHYSVITSYRQSNMGKYGNIVWTGKTPTDTKKYQTAEEPQKGIPVKAGASGVVRQPVATTFKQRKVMSPEAIQEMADDLAKTKLQGKASLRTPPALLKQTLTDSFKQWFGNSKVVNTDGTPKVMYHGTARDITEFRAKQVNAIFVTDNPDFAENFTDLSENYMIKELYNGMSDAEKTSVLNKALALAKKTKTITKDGIAIVNDHIKQTVGSSFGLNPTEIEDETNYILKEMLPSRANIMPVFVRAENPFDYDNPEHIARIVEESKKIDPDSGYTGGSYVAQVKNYISSGSWENIETKPVQNAIKSAGFDGFYIEEGGNKNLAVYEPNQIKSAAGNTGAFSRESKDIRYSLTNNAPPAVHTKLTPNQTAGQQVTAAATGAIDAVRSDSFWTKFRNGWVDDTSGLAKSLSGLSQFADNKLRADILIHFKANTINLIKNGLLSGVPVLNSDGSIIIQKSESNMARSLILADKLDSNGYVKASKLKGGRAFVAEVARALRGADIRAEDAAMIAEGQQKIKDADALEAKLNAAVKAGETDVGAITRSKTEIDKIRREGKELISTKREHQVDDAQIQWAEAQLKNVPEIQEIFKIWKDINTALTDLSEDTGVISKEQADKYRDKKFYVPLFKAREDLAETLFKGSSAKAVAKNYKLEGSEAIRNVWENLDKQYAMTVAVAYENQTRKVATEQLKGFGLAKTVDNPNDPNINLRYKEDGKIVNVIAENPTDIAAFQMMNYELGPIMKGISATTKALRFGALVNPMFWVKQLIRDPIHASLTNSQIITPFHSAKEFAMILANSSKEAKLLAERGVIGGVDSTVSLNEYLGQVGKEKMNPNMMAAALHKIMGVHEASDAATRVAIFKSAKAEALRNGKSEEEAVNFAVYRARESINFGVRGNSPILNTLRHSIPFFQAAITSLDTVYRAATGYGLPPAERKKAQQIFIKRAAVMTALSLAYAMMYSNDDEYKDLPDYIKDGNWLYPVIVDGRKTFVKIPVPFEIGFLFKTIPEAAWRYYSGTSTGKEVAKSYWDGLLHNLPGGGLPIPQAFKPALESITNHSFFTGNPIEGMSDQGKPVVERGRNASEAAKMLSQAGLHNVGLSPAKIDALIKGYFAELGGTSLMAASYVVDAANGIEKSSKNIENYPVVKAFMTDPNVSKAVSDFYGLEHNAKEMTNMFADLKKDGLFERAKEYVNDEDKRKQLVAAPVFRSLGEKMGKIQTAIRQVEARQGMDADEKRTRINELYQLLNQTAKKGYEVAERAGISR